MNSVNKITYTTDQKFGLLCSPMVHLVEQKYSKMAVLWNIITF